MREHQSGGCGCSCGCGCDCHCCQLVWLVVVVVMAAIIVRSKRKLFYGWGYGVMSTIPCWMWFLLIWVHESWKTKVLSSLEVGAYEAFK